MIIGKYFIWREKESSCQQQRVLVTSHRHVVPLEMNQFTLVWTNRAKIRPQKYQNHFQVV